MLLMIFVLIVLLFMFFIWMLPIVVGLVIGCVGNVIYSRSARVAPLWWNIVTGIMTAMATILYNMDIFLGENVDFGTTPLLILGIYALGSMLVYAFFVLKTAPKTGIGKNISVAGDESRCERIKAFFRRKNNRMETEQKKAAQSVVSEYRGWSDDLRKGLKKSSDAPAVKEYNWKLKETWEDYPVPDYEALHTYCKVFFTESDRTYYYRTRNPELQVGDRVYVPIGYKHERRIGTIVSMEDYVGREAPYPLEKTKHIIGKAW